LSLRAKITAAIVGLILTMGLAGTFHARFTLGNELRGELVQRGTTIAGDISSRSEEALITNDVFALYELINTVLVNDKDVRYVFVVDANGEVRAKTLPGSLPAGLLVANGLNTDGADSVARLPSDEGPIQDVAYPILGGKLGLVRVGLSENRMLDRVNAFTFQLLGLTGGITLLALVVSFLMAAFLTGPLAKLAAAARAVGRGDLSQRVTSTTGDEVGRLATAFNAMIEDLAQSRQEINEFNRELLRRSQELSTLNAVAATISQSLDLQVVMESALDKVLPLIGADAGGILLWDAGAGGLVYRASRGLTEEFVQGVAGLGHGEGIAGKVVATGEAIVVEDIAADQRVTREVVRGSGLRSFASIPLQAKERIVGVMNIARTDRRPFDNRDVQLLTAIGHQVGVAVENARLWQELKEKERARSDLLKKVISAQEEERQRIARELHDELAQGLTALLMGLGRLEQSMPDIPATTTRIIESVKQFASRTVEDTRRLILDLRPPVLDDLGLLPAVRMLAETRLEQQGVGVSLTAEGLETRLPSHLEVTIFRVLQEAISNCARHAQAKSVRIHLEGDGRRFRAIIQDDGVGFDTSTASRSADGKSALGIVGMRERASLLGGTLGIRSRGEEGTTVELDVPLVQTLATR
jgi:signal transduction histidine kinase